jgi:hypothetical protein
MANWTLLQARNKVKWFLQPRNVQFYLDAGSTETSITDLINEGLADMTSTKAQYMLWDNHDVPCVAAMTLTLDDDMLSVKHVWSLTSETDEYPHELLRPEDYDIADRYMTFTAPMTCIIRIRSTRKPTPLTLDTDTLPLGSPFQLGIVYYAVAQCCMRGGNAGVALAGQYMGLYDRLKTLWEKQTLNEHITLRGQDDNPANDGLGYGPYAEDPQGRIDSET